MSITITFYGLFICIIALLFLMFLQAQNNWLVNNLVRYIQENELSNVKLPSYRIMLFSFWVWKVENFFKK